MIIKTKQFILRPFKMSDAKDIAININDWAIIKNLALPIYPYQLKHAKDYLKKSIASYKIKDPENYGWAIVVNSEVVGAVGLHKIVKGHKSSMGYWLAKKCWGNGIMTQAVKLVSDYAFKKYKLKRVYAEVFSYNPGSKRVLEKAGFKVEGLMKKEAKKGKKFVDAYLLAKVK